MPTKWTLSELTEFDLRLQTSSSSDVGSLPPPEDTSVTKSEVLHGWMVRQREDEPEAQRLATIAVQSEHWFAIGFWVFSFLAGISAGAALLRYEGDRLINISAYLGILVGGQLLMLIGLGISSLVFKKPVQQLHTLILPQVIKALPSPLSLRAWGWRLFSTFQQAGIALNLGILLVTVWKVFTYDLAFGWATTLDTGGGTIHKIVQTLASPWGGTFAPSLEQIEQSRIALKSGLAHIDSQSTAAWWPFLLMCVLVYGLLPRIILASIGEVRLRWVLKKLTFPSSESEKLYLSLTRTPLQFTSFGKEDPASSDTRKSTVVAFKPENALRLEVDSDILAPEKVSEFKMEIEKLLPVTLSDDASGRLRVVELWQPPLEETLRELRHIRQNLGPETEILLLGVGFPSSESTLFFKAPEEQDVEVWQNKLNNLNDPRLGLLPWRTS